MFTKTSKDRYGDNVTSIRWGRVSILVVSFLLLLIILLTGFYIVPAGNVGVITQWGAVNRVVYPGLGTKIPIAEGIIIMNVQTQKDEVDAGAASSDLQVVTSKIAVNYHLDPSYAVEVYQNIGTEYASRVLAPSIQNVFKAITAQFTAEQLIQQREKVRLQAEESLKSAVAPYHIVVENFNITNFDFSKEFNSAIEEKQVAQQQVETAKQKLAQAQVEAQQALTVAQGQANAQKALKDAGSLSPEYLQWLSIQKWNGILPQVTGGAIPFISVDNLAKDTTK